MELVVLFCFVVSEIVKLITDGKISSKAFKVGHPPANASIKRYEIEILIGVKMVLVSKDSFAWNQLIRIGTLPEKQEIISFIKLTVFPSLYEDG